MNLWSKLRFPLFSFVICMSALIVFAASLSGKWQCSFYTPDGDIISAVLVFEQSDGQLKGYAESNEGRAELENCRVESESFSCSIWYQGEQYELRGKFQNDRIEGQWIGYTSSGRWEGKRIDG